MSEVLGQREKSGRLASVGVSGEQGHAGVNGDAGEHDQRAEPDALGYPLKRPLCDGWWKCFFHPISCSPWLGSVSASEIALNNQRRALVHGRRRPARQERRA